jgi:hypothetical protein
MTVIAVVGCALAGCLALSASAQASTGGSDAPGAAPPPAPTGPAGKATLLSDGTALAPQGAPPQVVNAIAAGNQIHTLPYVWGGGHRSFSSNGYDCSGAVSFVLHAAGLLSSPLPSGPLMHWGAPGHGRWITIFASPSHAYMVVAGLRFDTSAVGESLNQGSGPRWRQHKRPRAGYAMRYYPSL